MAASPRWLPLLVLGLLVGLPGSFGWIGAERFSGSRNGGGIGRRRLREGRPAANETASSSMAERLARPTTVDGLGQIWVVGSYQDIDLSTVGSSGSASPRRLIRNNDLSLLLSFTPFAFSENVEAKPPIKSNQQKLEKKTNVPGNPYPKNFLESVSQEFLVYDAIFDILSSGKVV